MIQQLLVTRIQERLSRKTAILLLAFALLPALAPAQTPDRMARIPAGNFTMGDPFAEGGWTQDSIYVPAFYMGKTEVAFDDFDAFCTATGREKPNDLGWGRGLRPVINVDWYDAAEYCNWLSQQQKLSPAYIIDKTRQDTSNTSRSDKKKWTVTLNSLPVGESLSRPDGSRGGAGYRLPTETEWEFAAREGGKRLRFGNGKDIADPAQINFNASANYKKDYSVAGEYRHKTVPVNEMLGAANRLGLRHMSGNVLEWCSDWYGSYPASTQPGLKSAGSGSLRVLRGGSWYNSPQVVRATDRYSYTSDFRNSEIGFRVARSVSF